MNHDSLIVVMGIASPSDGKEHGKLETADPPSHQKMVVTIKCPFSFPNGKVMPSE